MWCGTLNNYRTEQIEEMQEFIKKECVYGIYGEEVAPNTGTEHLQCYWHLKEQQRGSFIINKFPGIHIEKCKGTEEQNIRYCRKEGNYWEYGQMQKQTERFLKRDERVIKITTDYLKMAFNEFREAHPWEAYHEKNKLEQWRIDSLMVKDAWPGNLQDKNFWVWGPPGTGKSKWARSQRKPEEIFLKAANKWWGGYIDIKHKLVLFEDFPNDAKYLGNLMKVWGDRYTFTAEVKGGTIFIEPGNWILIVTSNFCMEECFDYNDYLALKRRFREVHVTDSNDLFLTSRIP